MNSPATEDKSRFIAYRIPNRSYPKLVAAPADRLWMDFSTKGWANRCLPLRIANQAGWFILNDTDFTVAWTGGRGLEAIKFKGDIRSSMVSSMFGYGILTWSLPYIFRTPTGVGLLVRGPTNHLKDGIAPLDGMVETDWLPYPFTMNWRFTRPGKTVKFEKDEPICMLTPIECSTIEALQPGISNLESDPDLQAGYTAWHRARLEIVERTKAYAYSQAQGMPAPQGHYIRGEGHLGERPASAHRNNLKVGAFRDLEPAIVSTHSMPSTSKSRLESPSALKRWMVRFGLGSAQR